MNDTIKGIKVGDVYNRWTVLEYAGKKHGSHYWLCRCSCRHETTKSVLANNLIKGKSKGCMRCGNEKGGKKRRVKVERLKEDTENKGFVYCGYEYINGEANIKYKCKKHLDKGIQITTHTNIKKSTGKCIYCRGKHKTTLDFINEMKEKNPNIEILGEYINAKTKIRCRCLIDDYEWTPKPNGLLCGTGCPECARNNMSIESTKTHKQFLDEMKAINPNVEFLSHYTNVKERIKCRCLIDKHEWTTTPDSLIQGSGCPVCLKQRMHDEQVKSNEQFLDELSIVNPNIKPLEEYYNGHTKIKCKCLKHNYTWYATPNKILHRKTGCPKCAVYHNERIIDEILDDWKIKYTVQKRFDDCRNIYPLPFDKYLTDYGILIEYDGEGHYKPINWGGMADEEALEQLELVKYNDAIKNEYCKINNIPLIRIPYWEKDNMEHYLFNELVKCGVIEEIKSA